jgi:glycosyltransferase involved in cell wall biosynthesis
MSQLKVCFVTQELPDFFVNGGAGTATLGFAEFLGEDTAFKVDLIYTSGMTLSKDNVSSILASDRYSRLKVHLLQDLFGQEKAHVSPKIKSFLIYQWLKENRYDIVYFTDFDALGFYSITAKRSGLDFAQTHLSIITHGPTEWGHEASRKFLDFESLEVIDMERECLLFADSVVSPSEYMKNWITKRYGKNQNANYIQRYVLPKNEVFTTKKFLPAKSGNLNEIVFFGRFEVRKGFLIFLEAAKKVLQKYPDIRIGFLGRSEHIDGVQASHMIGEYLAEFTDRVTNYGAKKREECKEILSGFGKLTVIPSIDENFPFTLMEAVDWRLNFISSNAGGMPEVFETETPELVIFNPNVRDLTSLIEKRIRSSILPNVESKVKRSDAAASFLNFTRFHANEKKLSSYIHTDEIPLISIIIVHYQRTHLLDETITSILNQDYQNFEVVIVDDGSFSKEHLEYLELIPSKFHQISIKVLKTPDVGLSAARNYAAEFANGEILLFADDDNIFSSNMISTMAYALLRSESDCCISLAIPFEGDLAKGNIHDMPEYMPIGNADLSGILRNNFGDAHSIWQRSSFDSIKGFDADFYGAEDWDIYSRLRNSGGSILVIPEPLYMARKHVNSLTQRRVDFVTSRHRILQNYSKRSSFFTSYALNSALLRNFSYSEKFSPSLPNKITQHATSSNLSLETFLLAKLFELLSQSDSRVKAKRQFRSIVIPFIKIKRFSIIPKALRLSARILFQYFQGISTRAIYSRRFKTKNLKIRSGKYKNKKIGVYVFNRTSQPIEASLQFIYSTDLVNIKSVESKKFLGPGLSKLLFTDLLKLSPEVSVQETVNLVVKANVKRKYLVPLGFFTTQ